VRAPPARKVLFAELAALAAALVFLPSLSHGWVNWDDDVLIVGNPMLRAPVPFSALARWAFSSAPAGAYQPLDYLAWAALGRASGFDPRAFHLASLLLHALCAALVFLVARRLLALAPGGAAAEPDAAADFGALFAALVFAVHPLRVESVSWAAELRDPLSGALWLGALLAYLRAREPGRPRRSLVPTAALFAGAALAKGIAVTLPLVLLVVDAWPLRRRPADVWREKLPMLGLAAGLGAVSVLAQRGARASATWADHGLAARLAQTAYALVFYARKTLWPSGLSPIYELRPPLDPLEPRFVLSAAVLAAFAVWAWRARRARPWWTAAGAASALVALPVGGLLQSGSQLVADRYSYLSALPWALLAGAGLRAGLRRPGPRRAASALAALAAAAALGAACVAQESYWRDSEALWGRALALDPRSGTALLGLGTALAARGRYAEAEALFARAEDTDRACAADLERLALLAGSGEAGGEEARRLRAALDPRPVCRRARSNRAAARAALGDFAWARAGFAAALAADPDDASARANAERLERLERAQPR
jgi:hypothetical protein